MAGGQVTKSNPKLNAQLKTAANSNEVLKETKDTAVQPQKFTLRGILGLNRPVEVNQAPQNLWTKENFGISSLTEQSKILLDTRQKELERAIRELQAELQQLAHTTEGIDKNLENAVLENIPEASEYQISFLQRLKNLVVNFRKNLNEASVWLESFNTKKKKKNYFWSMAKDKKKGGEAYMFSEEHSIARSVG